MAGMAVFCHTAQAQSSSNNATLGIDTLGIDDATKSISKDVIIVIEKTVEEMVLYYDQLEVKPKYPGGDEAMYEFMSTNLVYPAEAQKEGIQGTVVVQFLIEKDGSVTNAKAVRSPHESLSNEAVRMILSMPKWSPGMNNDQPVRVNFTLPVRFKLTR